PHFLDKVYKVEKALYGLDQAPRAWYETFSTYLLENRSRRGIMDTTLFIKKDKGDLLLVQVYVDDTIFGSTKKSLCTEFKGLMHKKFQMSFMGELTLFLGLQVMQRDDGIFLRQDKYVADILKKFDFFSVKKTSTPIETKKALLKDEEAEDVDVYLYILIIGSLMYLTAFRPDIMIFRYLKGQPKLGLWYLRDSPFDLEAFSDSDYARASLDRKSTTRVCQFLGKRLILRQCKKQTVVANSTTKAEYVAATNCCGHMAIVMNLELKLVVEKVSTAEHKLVLNGCLDWNETTANDEIQVSAIGLTYYCSTMASAFICLAINQKFNFSKYIFNNMVKHLDGGVKFLMYPRFVQVLDLEEAKITQVKEIAGLKKRVKKLEHNRKSRNLGLKRLRKFGSARRVKSSTEASLGNQEDASKHRRMIDNIDQDVKITLVDDTQGRMNEEDMFGVNDLNGDEVVVDVLASEKVEQSVKVVEKEVSTADPVTTAGEIVTTADIEVTTAATTL
nr:putative ribonuclease H-like domain-containing protein [Tanacetum cinerariifolium]GEY30575.1 putative ribonuclease H-like domain-containing protein [Tanacetum cinerariifolium]